MFNYPLGYYLIFIWIILEIVIFKWMFNLKPGKNLKDKYPKKIIFLSQLPFGSRWKNSVDKEDIELFENYQHRIKIWYLSLVIPFISFFMKNIT
jgi:hypothetical protein